jgi:hypothetical protein
MSTTHRSSWGAYVPPFIIEGADECEESIAESP